MQPGARSTAFTRGEFPAKQSPWSQPGTEEFSRGEFSRGAVGVIAAVPHKGWKKKTVSWNGVCFGTKRSSETSSYANGCPL